MSAVGPLPLAPGHFFGGARLSYCHAAHQDEVRVRVRVRRQCNSALQPPAHPVSVERREVPTRIAAHH
jgi:hypothetical protein